MPEFHAIHKQWLKKEDTLQREAWERTRMLALYTLAPHSSKKLNPKSVMKLPWDKLSKEYIDREQKATENRLALDSMLDQMKQQGIKIDTDGEA